MEGERKTSRAFEVPILYPCQKGEHDGYANFGDPEMAVRALTPEDLNRNTPEGQKFLAKVGPNVWRFVEAIHAIKIGFRRRAPAVLKKWLLELYEELFPEPNQSDAQLLENVELIGTFASGYMSVTELLPHILSREIQDVRLVLWWSDKAHRFLPAFFCPTAARAALTTATLGFVGRLVMICPRCGRLFVAQRSDQECCSPKCREARRQARYREEKLR
jgi:hypothetical protein